MTKLIFEKSVDKGIARFVKGLFSPKVLFLVAVGMAIEAIQEAFQEGVECLWRVVMRIK